MLNPEEDTEWNDILRSKGILPPKAKEAEVTEDQIVSIVEDAIKQKTGNERKDLGDMNLDELDELEDSEDEYVLEEYRRKRIAELKATAEKAKFGSVYSISAQDYVDEVNKAGEGVWVVLHLYAPGLPLCNIINHYLSALSQQYRQTKFLKSVATTCIPNFPEKNCPSIFIYFEGHMKKQFIGPIELRGDKLTKGELEWMLGQTGAIETTIKEDPRPKIRDKLQDDLDFCDL